MDDPEWVPTHKMVLESPGSPMPYTLRPRRPKFTNEEENDNIDQLILSNTKIQTKSKKDLVITISQRIRKDPAVVDSVQNEQLPCIPFPIHTFDDLYKLADHVQSAGSMYKDCQRLPELLPVLKELNDMVGLKSTKNALCNMILFELQSIPCYWRHMVITGAPGMGKTSIATIIGKLLNKLGRTPSSDITRGNPLNMIADYEGQTKSEVNRVVQEALSKSGVLLIDEAPSLYDKQNKDSYGKKCLDMLMQLMDTYRDRLIVIFAGYKKDMEENILQSNEGFRRRIQWYFHMDEYTPDELHLIFQQKMGVLTQQTIFNQYWFRTNYKAFPFFGGSIENFVQKIRIVHTRKTFGSAQKDVITDETIQEGFELTQSMGSQTSTTTSTTTPEHEAMLKQIEKEKELILDKFVEANDKAKTSFKYDGILHQQTIQYYEETMQMTIRCAQEKDTKKLCEKCSKEDPYTIKKDCVFKWTIDFF